MKKSLLLATHHKTGTVWLGTVFRKFSKLVNLPYFALHRIDGYSGFSNNEKEKLILNKIKENGPCLFFEHHSRFPIFSYENIDKFKGIHMIRNPKHVIAYRGMTDFRPLWPASRA